MKKMLFCAGFAGAVALGGTSVSAQNLTSFTAGDLVVYRTGDGSAALSSAGTAVFLDEYTPAGTLVGSYEMPTTIGTPFVASGSAGSEGLLTTSGNGAYLVVPGYDAAVGTTGVSGSTTILREVATVSASTALVQTTINSFYGNNFRSAASPDGTTIYAAGATTGILAVTSGASNTAGTAIGTTGTAAGNVAANNTGIAIFNGQLYVSSAKSTTYRLATLGSVASLSGTSTATSVNGIPIGANATTTVGTPYQFVATTLTLGGTTTDTIYVADSGTGTIEKFSGSLAGGFTLTGTATVAGVVGLTGTTVGTTEDLYATTGTNIYSIVDASGAGGTLTATATSIATAGTNEAFRGITFAPTTAAVPEPSSYVWLITGGAGLLLLARRRLGGV